MTVGRLTYIVLCHCLFHRLLRRHLHHHLVVDVRDAGDDAAYAAAEAVS